MRWDEFTPGNSIATSGHSLPVDYEIEGILLVDVEVGGLVYVARTMPSGALRLFSSSPVIAIISDGFATANSIYRVEAAGELAEFAPLAELLLREIQDA
jgi:hypothetical protein